MGVRRLAPSYEERHPMTDIEIKAVDHEATCEELRGAIARQQEILSEMERAPLAIAGGGTLEGICFRAALPTRRTTR